LANRGPRVKTVNLYQAKIGFSFSDSRRGRARGGGGHGRLWDPTDRMLIATAIRGNLTIITNDSAVAPYGLKTI